MSLVCASCGFRPCNPDCKNAGNPRTPRIETGRAARDAHVLMLSIKLDTPTLVLRMQSQQEWHLKALRMNGSCGTIESTDFSGWVEESFVLLPGKKAYYVDLGIPYITTGMYMSVDLSGPLSGEERGWTSVDERFTELERFVDLLASGLENVTPQELERLQQRAAELQLSRDRTRP